MITPIIQESLVDQVENKLYDFIREKHLVPGDNLPKEAELAEALQISRPIVREALSRLRMIGLVSSRKRRGMIISKPNIFKTIGKVVNSDFLEEREQQDFFNLRITIELGLADLLVKNITSDDIKKLDQVVGHEELKPADFRYYLACDCEFHSRIYEATHCKSLASFQSILIKFFNDYETRVKTANPNFENRFLDPGQTTHRTVLEAIKTMDPEKIQRTMRKHLKPQLNKKISWTNK